MAEALKIAGAIASNDPRSTPPTGTNAECCMSHFQGRGLTFEPNGSKMALATFLIWCSSRGLMVEALKIGAAIASNPRSIFFFFMTLKPRGE